MRAETMQRAGWIVREGGGRRNECVGVSSSSEPD